jgi:proteasome beta subunit
MDSTRPTEHTTGGTTEFTTGTTTVGVTAADGVVLGADRRASLGGRFVGSKDAKKVFEVAPTAAVTISGSVGDGQAFVRRLRSEARLYELERGRAPSTESLATLAGELLRGGRTIPLLGGVDDEPRLYQLDPGGGVLPDAYAASGSGSTTAYGVLERGYEPDATVDDAVALAEDAIAAASERDTASGNGSLVATITSDGVAYVGGAS